MRFRLSFEGRRISGAGVDGDGPFDFSGEYEPEDRFVTLHKRYRNLNVCYRGEWDGAMVSGRSVITAEGFYDTGEFEMWPESDEEDLRVAFAAEQEAKSPVSAKLDNSGRTFDRLNL